MTRIKSLPRRSFVRLESLEDRTAPALFTQFANGTSNQLNNNGHVVAGDWNKDGIQDLVLANYGLGSAATAGKTITFAFGDGTGKFGSYSSQAVGPGSDAVSFIAVGDLNNDGNPDIVTANTNEQNEDGTLSVFLGSAAGAFSKTAASPQAADGSRTSWVGIADFNKDGKMDVAVVNIGEQGTGGATGRSISIFKGDGLGGLTSFNKIDIPLANGVALAGAIGDLNGDTWPDLAVTFANVPPDDLSPQIDGSIRTFMNKQDGTLQDFASSSEYTSGGPFPISIVAADFSGDGKTDLVVANAGDPDNANLFLNFGRDKSIGTLTNGGTGTFGPTVEYTVGFSSAFAVAVADVNLDSKLDILIADIGKPGSLLGGGAVKGGLAVYLGKTSGAGFSLDPDTPYVSPSDAPQYLVVAPFNTNTDQTPDVVLVHESNSIVTFLNTTNPGVATTTTLAATPASPATFGSTVTLTATVAAPAGTPTGTVTFYNGSVSIGTGTLGTVGGAQVATFQSSTLAVGNYTFSAKYEGITGFAVSKSADTPYAVDKAVTTTTLAVTPSSTTAGGSVKFTATVASAGGTPSGTVAFFDNGVQIGTGPLADVLGQQQASFTTTGLAVGSHPITAQFLGSTSFATSTSGSKTVTINPSAPATTTTTLTGTPNPSLFGQSVTFTASVVASAGTPSGSVTFTENGVVVGGPVPLADVDGVMKASVSISNLTPGTHPIVATYGGVVGFSASSTLPLSHLVNNTATATSVTTGPGGGPYAFESNVTFTATVTATAGVPAGSVQFSVDGATFGTPVTMVNVGGSMQATVGTTGLPVGTHQVTAQFLGSVGQDPSGSGPATVTISSVGTTTTVVPNPTTVTQGQAVTLTATVARNATVTPLPGGTVTFRNGATVLGTAPVLTVGGAQVATVTTTTLPRGTVTVTAEYAGDATFGSSTSAGATVTVNGSASGLVGYREFGVGVGAGLNDTAQFYNPDGTLRFSLNLFPGFTGGVRVTSADFTGDGVADLVAGTGPGAASQVVVLDGVTKATIFTINPFEAAFKGGVFVAAGDITGDGKAELVISPDEGGGPRVRAFNGVGFTQIADFFGIDDPNFRGGARAAVADMNGDLKGDLIVSAGFMGGPRVAVYDGSQLASTGGPKFFGDFFVFEETLRNGAYVAGGDVNGDGFADLIAGGGPGGGPRVYALSGKDLIQSGAAVKTAVANFFAGDENNRGGIRVVARDLDGDNRADIVTGSGDKGGTRVSGYLGKNTPVNGTPPTVFSFDAMPGFNGGVFVG
jgi:hypothetical protein